MRHLAKQVNIVTKHIMDESQAAFQCQFNYIAFLQRTVRIKVQVKQDNELKQHLQLVLSPGVQSG